MTSFPRGHGRPGGQWFNDFLGQPLPPGTFDPGTPAPVQQKWTGDLDAHTQFADGFAVLVTSEASIDDLNRRLVAKGLGGGRVERFRPTSCWVVWMPTTKTASTVCTLPWGRGDRSRHRQLRHVKPVLCPLPDSPTSTRPPRKAAYRERYAEHLPTRRPPGQGHYLRHECRGGPSGAAKCCGWASRLAPLLF